MTATIPTAQAVRPSWASVIRQFSLGAHVRGDELLGLPGASLPYRMDPTKWYRLVDIPSILPDAAKLASLVDDPLFDSVAVAGEIELALWSGVAIGCGARAWLFEIGAAADLACGLRAVGLLPGGFFISCR